MKQPTLVKRIPSEAYDAFCGEALRQGRDVKLVMSGAARAFIKLSPAQREEFTIGEPPTIQTAKSLLGRTRPAPANRRRNGGAK